MFIFVLLIFCSGEDLLDSSIYGPQTTNGGPGPQQVDHHQLDMSGYEGATLGQPSKLISFHVGYATKLDFHKIKFSLLF